jgi:hypothetical protein
MKSKVAAVYTALAGVIAFAIALPYTYAQGGGLPYALCVLLLLASLASLVGALEALGEYRRARRRHPAGRAL